MVPRWRNNFEDVCWPWCMSRGTDGQMLYSTSSAERGEKWHRSRKILRLRRNKTTFVLLFFGGSYIYHKKEKDSSVIVFILYFEIVHLCTMLYVQPSQKTKKTKPVKRQQHSSTDNNNTTSSNITTTTTTHNTHPQRQYRCNSVLLSIKLDQPINDAFLTSTVRPS